MWNQGPFYTNKCDSDQKTIPSAAENVERVDPPRLLVGTKMKEPHWKPLWEFLRVQHKLPIGSSNSTTRHLSDGNKNICSLKPGSETFGAAWLTIGKNLTATQRATDWWMNKRWPIWTMEFYSATTGEKSGWSYSMEDPERHAKWKKPVTKDYTLSHSIYVQCPERSHV